MIRKVLGWAVVIFIGFYVVTRPAAAAHTVQSIGHGLLAVGNGLGSFFTAVSR